MMRIEVDFCLEDLEELYTPEVYATKPSQFGRKMRTGILGWLVFFIIAVGWYFTLLRRSRLPFPRPDYPARDLQTDIFTLLLPGCLVLLFTGVLVFRLWRGSKWRPETSSVPPAPNRLKKRLYAVLIWLVIAAVAFVCINGAWTHRWNPPKGQVFLLSWGPWLLSLVILTAVASRSALWQARKTWFTTPGFARHHTLELDDWGLRLWTNLSRTEMHWSTFTRARETRNLLVLVSETKLQYLIPKRAFASEADVEAARALLHNKIQNTTFLAQTLGFPMTPKPVLPLPPILDASPSTGDHPPVPTESSS